MSDALTCRHVAEDFRTRRYSADMAEDFRSRRYHQIWLKIFMISSDLLAIWMDLLGDIVFHMAEINYL